VVWDVNLSISGVIENHFDVGEMLALFSITSGQASRWSQFDSTMSDSSICMSKRSSWSCLEGMHTKIILLLKNRIVQKRIY